MFLAANNASRRMLTRAGGNIRAPAKQLNIRTQTTGPPMPKPKKGGVSAAVGGAAAVTLGLGGTLAYAWFDPAFRDSLEATVPFSETPLALVLGERTPALPPMPVQDVPSKMRKPPPKPAAERQEKKMKEDLPKPEAADPTPATVPAAEPPAAAAVAAEPSAPAAESRSPDEDEAARAQQRAQTLETEAAMENMALEQTLRELSERAEMALDVAVDAQQYAASAVVAHVERVFRSLDDSSETDWAEVKDSADAKTQLHQKADQLAQGAREYLDQLTSVLDESRRNKLTAANEKLTAVQEALSNAYYRLDSAQNKLAAALSEARVMEEFRRLVDESRTKFQLEMSSIVPGVVVGEKNTKLSEDELNMLLVHAYRKVLYLQKELARMLTVEQQKFSSALERQRQELDGVLDEKLTTELSRQQRQAELRHQQALDALQSELENEMRQQLRRQAGAHSDHLQDVLTIQERELRRKLDSAHEDRVRGERAKFQAELAEVTGSLRGVRDAITARADLDKAAHQAQKMWVACQGLKQAIRTGQLGASSWQAQLKPLKHEVAAIREVAGESAPFVEAVLATLPEEVLERGVYTEDAMRERFFKVERLCKRVSMVGDQGGSLFKYALSYLQALLVVDTFERLPIKEQRDQPISTDLTAYEIVARARYCIDKDDLVQAVRYLGLLKGEARLVASDWLRETRLLLEARQAADALLAHAAATGLQAL